MAPLEFHLKEKVVVPKSKPHKEDKFVTGAKTHPLFFDERTPDEIITLDKNTLKTKCASFISYLNMRDKIDTLTRVQ